ncbi:MAG: hypothetical protein WCG99_03495 [Candidatus Berkelbacteria bacterium]
MRLKLFNDGKTVLATTRHRKTQITSIIKSVNHQSAYIYVEYLKGCFNDSYHESDESLTRALNDYTEKSLINSIVFWSKK